eukprot:tig00000405_g436.t1
MWSVLSQLAAFLPQTDDDRRRYRLDGRVMACRRTAGGERARPAAAERVAERAGRWVTRAVSRLRILDPSSTAWMIESRGDGRRERRAAAWIARRGVGSAGGGPGRTPRAPPAARPPRPAPAPSLRPPHRFRPAPQSRG